MDKKTEALKLSLEAFKQIDEAMPFPVAKLAQKAIREALAQPEREPVATLDDLEQEIYENTRQFVSRDVMEWMLKRYYTTQPQRTWVGLTNDEIVDAYDVAIVSFKRSQQGIRGQMFTPSDSPDWHYAKAIEAALKEKNA